MQNSYHALLVCNSVFVCRPRRQVELMRIHFSQVCLNLGGEQRSGVKTKPFVADFQAMQDALKEEVNVYMLCVYV